MLYTKIIKQQKKIKYVKIDIPIRYGDEDMAFDAPLREGDRWVAIIDLDTHKIVDWKEGFFLNFIMKICDEGTYTLLDENKYEITKLENEYVPNNLLPGEWGDYLDLEIAKDGTITNWLKNPTLQDFEENDND